MNDMDERVAKLLDWKWVAYEGIPAAPLPSEICLVRSLVSPMGKQVMYSRDMEMFEATGEEPLDHRIDIGKPLVPKYELVNRKQLEVGYISQTPEGLRTKEYDVIGNVEQYVFAVHPPERKQK